MKKLKYFYKTVGTVKRCTKCWLELDKGNHSNCKPMVREAKETIQILDFKPKVW